jgi:hypothetical protein
MKHGLGLLLCGGGDSDNVQNGHHLREGCLQVLPNQTLHTESSFGGRTSGDAVHGAQFSDSEAGKPLARAGWKWRHITL